MTGGRMLGAAVAAVAVVVGGAYWIVHGDTSSTTREPTVDAGAPATFPRLDASTQGAATVVDALAHDPMIAAAREQRDSVLGALRDSGAGHEGWEAQGTALLGAFSGHGTVADLGCYIAGCGAILTFSSHAAYQRALDQVQGSEAYRAWTGGKRLTIPELTDDGRVIIALVLYRPD